MIPPFPSSPYPSPMTNNTFAMVLSLEPHSGRGADWLGSGPCHHLGNGSTWVRCIFEDADVLRSQELFPVATQSGVPTMGRAGRDEEVDVVLLLQLLHDVLDGNVRLNLVPEQLSGFLLRDALVGVLVTEDEEPAPRPTSFLQQGRRTTPAGPLPVSSLPAQNSHEKPAY